MLVKISRRSILQKSSSYQADATRLGTWENDHLVLTEEAHRKLTAEHPPTLPQLAADFLAAFPAHFVPEKTYQLRLQICQACPDWDPAAWCHTGACQFCHCTRLKLHLATAQCPLCKWPA